MTAKDGLQHCHLEVRSTDVKCKLLCKQFRSVDPEMYFSEGNVKGILER